MNRNCYYHPQNTLYNFCVNTECALPLCPKCINIHLNQSNQKHHIQSLGETREMIQQQIQTAIEALQHNIESLKVIEFLSAKKGQFTPQFCINQYGEIVEKYRSEAISKINEHYDYIKRQLFEELRSKYLCHFSSIIAPLEQKMLELKKQRKNLQEKPIECMIKLISQETIKNVETLLQNVDEKKKIFKLELPRLEGVDENRLKIVPNSLQKTINKTFIDRENVKYEPFRTTGRILTEFNDLQRINRLEAELYNLRKNQCC